ncbi:PEP-utilizing enzyme [Zoogloeaceae bacterium G21618-S1]|nr:PEP-utilizing enzyme [Zoogloeaceae bacterium G21618-S1]
MAGRSGVDLHEGECSDGDWIDLVAAASAPVGAVGGKSRRLGLLRRLGLPTPDGLVIPASALAQGMPEACRARVAAELTRRGWDTVPLAVRSSAPHEDSADASFAGIYHSVLGVCGLPALWEAVDAVLASLGTPQAKAYRAHHALPDAGMAVLIMPMLPAVAAGVAFTCDPQSGRDDQIVINAVHGLGDRLVSGAQNGEVLVVQEDRRRDVLGVVSRQTGEAGANTVLSDAQVLALAQLLREAAQALDYADPAWDFEWVFDGERFCLVQARPVTAFPWRAYPGLAAQSAIWSNGNTRDVVPDVMGAMDWITWRRMPDMMLELGYRLAGFRLLPGVRRTALIGGRLYLNASLIQWEAFDALGVEPRAMNALLGGHHPEISVPATGWQDRLRRLGGILRYAVSASAWRRRGRRQATQAFADMSRWRCESTDDLDDAGLTERLQTLCDLIRSRDGMMFLQASSGGNLCFLLELIGRDLPAQSHALVAAIMAGGEPSVTARQAYEFDALARVAASDEAASAMLRAGAPWDLSALPQANPFRRGFEQFIDCYGHRGIYESYLSRPRFREDPNYLFALIAGMLDGADTGHEAQRRRQQDEAWQTLRDALPAPRRWLVGRLVRAARQEARDRELARSALIAHTEVCRGLILAAAERLCRRGLLADRDAVFDITPHELFDALAGRLDAAAVRERVTHRRQQRQAWDSQCAPEVVIGRQAQPPALATRSDDGVWRGVAVGSGIAEGAAYVARTPEHALGLAGGDILIAPSTDPAWTPLFLRAGGLVMETGGYLSHGAIVAREFGIPAVVNLPGIVEALQTGQRLRVDGSRGEVQPLD